MHQEKRSLQAPGGGGVNRPAPHLSPLRRRCSSSCRQPRGNDSFVCNYCYCKFHRSQRSGSHQNGLNLQRTITKRSTDRGRRRLGPTGCGPPKRFGYRGSDGLGFGAPPPSTKFCRLAASGALYSCAATSPIPYTFRPSPASPPSPPTPAPSPKLCWRLRPRDRCRSRACACVQPGRARAHRRHQLPPQPLLHARPPPERAESVLLGRAALNVVS